MRGLGYWKDGVVAYMLSDLSQSIFATLGVSNCINSLGISNNEGQRECLLLVDGMGINALEIVGKELPIFSQIKNYILDYFSNTNNTNEHSLATQGLSTYNRRLMLNL